jgi:hypothetical protein
MAKSKYIHKVIPVSEVQWKTISEAIEFLEADLGVKLTRSLALTLIAKAYLRSKNGSQ